MLQKPIKILSNSNDRILIENILLKKISTNNRTLTVFYLDDKFNFIFLGHLKDLKKFLNFFRF